MTWWLEFYDDLFADTFLAGAGAVTEQSVAFLERALELAPGARVFDQCCGFGRISLALAAKGYEVVGVDTAATYIARARAEAERRGLAKVELQVGDAFEFVPDARVDAAINWWTSFGYTADDARNALMLQRNMEALRPGGKLALDFVSVPNLLRHFRPRTESVHGDVRVIRESTLDFASGMLLQRWSFEKPGGARQERLGATRLYLPHTLRQLFEAAGFVDVKLFGGYDGRPYDVESTRCILVGRKPERA